MRPAACVALALLLTGGGPAPAGDPTADIVEGAVKAAGGADKLREARPSRQSTRGTITITNPYRFHQTVLAGPKGQVRELSEIEYDTGRMTVTTVIADGKGWCRDYGSSRPLGEKRMAELREVGHLGRVIRMVGLDGGPFQLTPLGEATVGGRSAVGLRVKAPGFRDVSVYVDKDTGLLAKSARKGVHPVSGRSVNEERFYSDYRDTGGMMLPYRLVILLDGQPYLDIETTEFTWLDDVDEQEFARP
jgi:hypothetical protein